ncbi:O-antigen ligase [Eubacterium sp. ER2]|uniref:O-antigen ligase family protein n=1 Tax=Eubacterium sp. ER2 TaxID=1519438 RepID=UPI0011CBCAB1|nr:O-antigen ligase family protein [Eubacterium sp. ER2]
MSYDERLLSKCLAMEIVISFMISVSIVLGFTSLASVLFNVSFLVPLLYILKKIRIFSTDLFVLLALCFVHVSINGLYSGGMMGVNYYKKVIMFTTFMYLLYFSRELRVCSKRILRIMKMLPIVAGVIFVLAYFVLGRSQTMGGGITLGFSNPNTLAMWLLHLILYGLMMMFDESISRIKFLYLPIIIVLVYMLWLTLSRACLLALVFFAVLLALRLFSIRPSRLIYFVIIMLPIIFAIVYLQVVDTTWVQTRFDFVISEGKSLTSRINVWSSAFDSIKDHFFFGNYSGLSRGTGQSQFHNTHVDVLASYGLIPFVLFLKILYKRTTESAENADTLYKYISLIAFCAVLIMGTFEAAMVAGSSGLNLMTIGMLVLANVNEQE